MVFWIGIVYSCAMGFAFAATYWTEVNGVIVSPDKADYLLLCLEKLPFPVMLPLY